MNRRFLLETVTLMISAALCAVVANAFASRERKLNLPGGSPQTVAQRRTPPATVPSAESRVPSAEPRVPAPGSQPATSNRQPATGNRQPATANRQPREFPPHPDKAWIEIDSAAVRELYARRVPFIDARRTNVYEQGHITGARSIPVWESDLDERLTAFYNEGLDQEAPVVVYCSGGDCEDSHMLAQRLWGIGFNNVLVYKDGYPDWVKHGGPTKTGPAQ